MSYLLLSPWSGCDLNYNTVSSGFQESTMGMSGARVPQPHTPDFPDSEPWKRYRHPCRAGRGRERSRLCSVPPDTDLEMLEMPGASISPGLTEMPQKIGRRFHALVRKMGESHSVLSFYQIYLFNKSQIHFSFIHGHFNPSQLLPLTPHLSPCLFSPSYVSFPSDFFFDHELFRSALTFPNTWKIWGFFPLILFSHFIVLY